MGKKEKSIDGEAPSVLIDSPKMLVVELEGSKPTSISDLVSGEKFPEANEAAILAAQGQAQKAAEEIPPETKQYNKDGSERKKRGRKPGGTNATLKKPDATANATSADGSQVSSASAAVVISGVLERLSTTLVSDEFIYSDLERFGNQKAWEAALDSYGGLHLSPVQALMVNHVEIIMHRMPKPKTQSKIKLIGAYFREKWANRKGRKKDARINDRAHNVGKDDIGKEKSQGATKAG